MKLWKTLVGMLAATFLLVACGDDGPSETSDAGNNADMNMTEDVQDDGGTQEGMSIKDLRGIDAVANLQQGATTDDQFTISRVVVSALEPGQNRPYLGVYVQDSSGDSENSGLFVTANSGGMTGLPPLSAGDVVSVSGRIQNDGGQLEMTRVEFQDVAEGGSPPSPVRLSEVSAVESGDYDGIFVRLDSQTVATWEPSNNGGTAEFDSGLVIGSTLYEFATDYPDVSSGETLSEVNGVVGVIDGERRVLPRNEGDLVTAGSGSGGGG